LWDILFENKVVIDKSEFKRFLSLGIIRINSIALKLEHYDIKLKPKDFIEIGSKKIHIQEDGNVHFIK
jgi:hypothetical protein